MKHCAQMPVAMILAVWLCACGTEQPPSPDKVRTEFAETPSKIAGDGSGESVRDLVIYIDGSQSMKGFVTNSPKDPSHTSNFAKVTRAVLEGARSSGHYSPITRKFTSTTTSIDDLTIAQILSPSFFAGADTPLSKLLESVGQDSGKAAIVISDLVQSEKGRDQRALASALTELGRKKMVVRLLAYRSSFYGSYFVEDRGHGPDTIALAQDETIPGHGRPFYLLTAAPNEQSLEPLIHYVEQHVKSEQVFAPTEAVWHIVSVTVARDGNWSPFTKSSMPWNDGVVFGTYVPAKRSPGNLMLHVIAALNPNLILGSPERIKMVVRRANYVGGNFAGRPVPVPGLFPEVKLTPDPIDSKTNPPTARTIEADLSLPVSPVTNGWDVYALDWSPGEGNLGVPPWLKDWATDTDAAPAFGSQTIGLGVIVQSMMGSISEKQTFFKEYLAIGR